MESNKKFSMIETYALCDLKYDNEIKWFLKYIWDGQLAIHRSRGKWFTTPEDIIDCFCAGGEHIPQYMSENESLANMLHELPLRKEELKKLNLNLDAIIEALWLHGELKKSNTNLSRKEIIFRLDKANLEILSPRDIFNPKIISALSKCKEDDFLKFAALKEKLKPHINLTDLATSIESLEESSED